MNLSFRSSLFAEYIELWADCNIDFTRDDIDRNPNTHVTAKQNVTDKTNQSRPTTVMISNEGQIGRDHDSTTSDSLQFHNQFYY